MTEHSSLLPHRLLDCHARLTNCGGLDPSTRVRLLALLQRVAKDSGTGGCIRDCVLWSWTGLLYPCHYSCMSYIFVPHSCTSLIPHPCKCSLTAAPSGLGLSLVDTSGLPLLHSSLLASSSRFSHPSTGIGRNQQQPSGYTVSLPPSREDSMSGADHKVGALGAGRLGQS